MSLIVKLGGYEKAKEYLENLNKIPLHEQAEDTITWLPDALLEYRRENNIFEAGDKVIYPWIGNAICVYDSENIINIDCIHATDEEIKAGHRL